MGHLVEGDHFAIGSIPWKGVRAEINHKQPRHFVASQYPLSAEGSSPSLAAKAKIEDYAKYCPQDPTSHHISFVVSSLVEGFRCCRARFPTCCPCLLRRGAGGGRASRWGAGRGDGENPLTSEDTANKI